MYYPRPFEVLDRILVLAHTLKARGEVQASLELSHRPLKVLIGIVKLTDLYLSEREVVEKSLFSLSLYRSFQILDGAFIVAILHQQVTVVVEMLRLVFISLDTGF